MKTIEKLIAEYRSRPAPAVSLAQFIGITEAQLAEYMATGKVPESVPALSREYKDVPRDRTAVPQEMVVGRNSPRRVK